MNALKLAMQTLAHDGFGALQPIIVSITDFLKDLVKEIDETVQSTKTDIENIMKIGDTVQDWLSRHSWGLIPPPARGTPDVEFDIGVTAPAGRGRALGTEGRSRGGGRGGGTKGATSEMELWQQELDQRLMAEHQFFADSTAEELAFWQAKLALTKNGSKEQFEIERKIFGLEKQLAHQNEAEAEAAIAAKQRVSDAYYQRQIAAIQSQERLGKITAAQAIAQEQMLLDQKWALDQKYFAKKLAAAENDSKTQQRINNDEAVAYQAYLTEKQRLATAAALQIQQSWQTTLRPIEDAFSTFMDDVIERTKSVAAAFDDMLRSILKSLMKTFIEGFFNGLFGQGAGGGTSGGFLGAGGNWLGALLNKTIGDAFGAAIGNPFASTATSGILGGILGNPFSATSGGLIGGSLGGIGAWFSSLFSSGAPAALAWIEKGGIMPSAAGGWVVPHFQGGGILSMLHRNEMVLPAHISQFVQDAAAAGGGAGGHIFNLHVSAWDSRSVMAAGPQIVAAVNRALRNGSMLYQPT
jgi:hypothetical protein